MSLKRFGTDDVVGALALEIINSPRLTLLTVEAEVWHMLTESQRDLVIGRAQSHGIKIKVLE